MYLVSEIIFPVSSPDFLSLLGESHSDITALNSKALVGASFLWSGAPFQETLTYHSHFLTF